jgi:hypothetical protein
MGYRRTSRPPLEDRRKPSQSRPPRCSGTEVIVTTIQAFGSMAYLFIVIPDKPIGLVECIGAVYFAVCALFPFDEYVL